MNSRPALSRERILQAAVALADRQGLEALTMRRLGAELDVEAMSLYKHVANKDAILDGMLEFVIGEIDVPDKNADWRESTKQRAISARTVLANHSWAIGLLEARGRTGSAALHYLDAVLGSLRSAGFSIDNAVHAFWLLDSYVYGHVVQETSLAASEDDADDSEVSDADAATVEAYPHLVEVQQHARTVGYSFDGEFEFGLELILDALERLAGIDASG